MISTRYRYPVVGQIVMVDIGHAFPVSREYCGIDNKGQHLFLDLETLSYRVGHCTWAPKDPDEVIKKAVASAMDAGEKEVLASLARLSLKEQGWQRSEDGFPSENQEVWIYHPLDGVVRCRFDNFMTNVSNNQRWGWRPCDNHTWVGHYVGHYLWRKVVRVKKLVVEMGIEDPPAAPVVPPPPADEAFDWQMVVENPPEQGQVVWAHWPGGMTRLCSYQKIDNRMKWLTGDSLGKHAGEHFSGKWAHWKPVITPLAPSPKQL